MSEQNFTKPEFRREIRLGLVVYGGVALAIYMNGVCREFYNAVRGRGIYKLVKALTDSDIVVDIVSGTSAGGINGVLLSYALSNSSSSEIVDFTNFAQIWRESGDILKLLRQPSPSDEKADSVLNGEGYYQNQLKEAFEKAYNNKSPAPEGEWVSPFRELDLFVTGTDVFGRIYKVLDDTGCVIEIKDHRAVFQLKHRQGRKEPFNPYDDYSLGITPEITYQALAKLCRITSCFPVAFPVVDVEVKGSDLVEQKLANWGKLDERELGEKLPIGKYDNLYFIDGGVLDNRPFSYTIKEMYYRTANRPVDRKLFYIDPSPDRFADNNKFTARFKPNTLQVIQDSLVGIPMYESIGNDLGLIKEHNEKVRRYKSLLANAETPTPSTDDALETIDIKETIYLRSRLISLRDRVLPLVLKIDQGVIVDSEKQKTLEKVATLLTEQVIGEKDKAKQEKIRQAFGQQIRNLDVEYSLRKHFYLLEKLYSLFDTSNSDNNLVDYRNLQRLSEKISRQIKLLEVIREALNQLLSYDIVSQSFYQLLEQEKPGHHISGQFYERLLRLHRFLLDVGGLESFLPEDKSYFEEVPADIFKTLPLKARQVPEQWLSQKQISSIFAQLRQKISTLTSITLLEEQIWTNPKFNYDAQENEAFSTILRQIELVSEVLIEASQLKSTNNLLDDFRKFRKLDQVLYPFEFMTNLTGRELIQTVRISPSDASLGLARGKKLEDKLAGDTLYAFGGFFKKSWRSNDILWGRLDGLNRIVEALVTPEAVKKFPEFIKRQYNCCQVTEEFESFKENYFEFLLDESLPNVKPSARQEIIAYLAKLANPQTLTEKELKSCLDSLVQKLVLEGHREIVSADLQNVLEDQIVEQFNWNRQRVQPAADGEIVTAQLEREEKPKYHPVPGYFDRSVSALAAGKLAREAIGDLSPEGKEEFFRDKYNVGKETVLDSVPTIVLANISTRFGLIFRNIVLTSLGDRNKILRRSIIYNFLDKSLQLFYFWLQLRGPSAVQTPNFTLKRPVILVIQIFLLLLAITGVVITVSASLPWVLITLSATLLFWLLGTPWKTTKKK